MKLIIYYRPNECNKWSFHWLPLFILELKKYFTIRCVVFLFFLKHDLGWFILLIPRQFTNSTTHNSCKNYSTILNTQDSVHKYKMSDKHLLTENFLSLLCLNFSWIFSPHPLHDNYKAGRLKGGYMIPPSVLNVMLCISVTLHTGGVLGWPDWLGLESLAPEILASFALLVSWLWHCWESIFCSDKNSSKTVLFHHPGVLPS